MRISDWSSDVCSSDLFNTFIDVYESVEFNNGEYAPKRDGEYAPGGGNPVDEILPILADEDAPPILSRSDTIVEKWRHPVTYFKSALGLILLREQILGPEIGRHTSELQSLMRISYAVFCLKQKKTKERPTIT